MYRSEPIFSVISVLTAICRMTSTGLSLVFGIFLTVQAALGSQMYIYLTVLMPSGETVSLTVMLFCAFVTGIAASTASGKLGTLLTITDSVLKLLLSLFVAFVISEVPILRLLAVLPFVCLTGTVISAVSAKKADGENEPSDNG
mgnify:FL=1